MEPIYHVGSSVNPDSPVKYRDITHYIDAPPGTWVQVEQFTHAPNSAMLADPMMVITLAFVTKTEQSRDGADEREYVQIVPVCLNPVGELIFVDRDDFPSIQRWRVVPQPAPSTRV